MIAYDNVYYLVEVKPTKKNLAARIWAKRAKIGPETRFFAIFSSLVYDDNLKQCLSTRRGKTSRKKF